MIIDISWDLWDNLHYKEKKNNGNRSKTAKSLLEVYKDEINDENKELLNIVANYKNDKELKKELLSRDCFKVNNINDMFFKILVYLGYI